MVLDLERSSRSSVSNKPDHLLLNWTVSSRFAATHPLYSTAPMPAFEAGCTRGGGGHLGECVGGEAGGPLP